MLWNYSSKCLDKYKLLEEIKTAIKAIISPALVKNSDLWSYIKKDTKIPQRTELLSLESRREDEFLIWLHNQTYRSWTGTKSGCNYQPIIKFKIAEWSIWSKARLNSATVNTVKEGLGKIKVSTRNVVAAWARLSNEDCPGLADDTIRCNFIRVTYKLFWPVAGITYWIQTGELWKTTYSDSKLKFNMHVAL